MTLIHDPRTRRLGKLAPATPRLMLADYLDVERALPQAPPVIFNSRGVQLAMYLNDNEGDCTIAAAGNTLRVNSRGAVRISDADVQAAYVAVTASEGAAYDPASGANDNGCVELDVLDHWTQAGIGANRLLGHGAVNMRDPDEHRVVAWLFGSVYLGLALAVEQQKQDVWDYAPGSQPGSWGGHAVPEFDIAHATAAGKPLITIGTWGEYKQCTPEFLHAQADEGHALVTDAWIAANEGNPLVNAQALAADLAKLRSEK